MLSIKKCWQGRFWPEAKMAEVQVAPLPNKITHKREEPNLLFSKDKTGPSGRRKAGRKDIEDKSLMLWWQKGEVYWCSAAAF